MTGAGKSEDYQAQLSPLAWFLWLGVPPTPTTLQSVPGALYMAPAAVKSPSNFQDKIHKNERRVTLREVALCQVMKSYGMCKGTEIGVLQKKRYMAKTSWSENGERGCMREERDTMVKI